MLWNLSFEALLFIIPAVVLGLVVHELAHALAAKLLGDDTAARQGRITLNPLKHIDPWGFVFLLLAGFGWGKPVSFNPNRLRHPLRDPVLVAMAGPFSNLLVAFLCLPLLLLTASLATGDPTGANTIPGMIQTFLLYLMSVNLGLFIFNLLPLPPLDGSHVLFAAMPNLSLERKIQIYQIGSFALLGILLFNAISKVDILPIGPMVRTMMLWMLQLAGLA